MNKVLYAAPLVALMLMTTFVLATETSFSLRSAVGEAKNVNINSNGVTGSGYVIYGMNGDSRVTYAFEQKDSVWTLRYLQIGRTRTAYNVPVTVNFDASTGVLTIPESGISANVVNLR